MKILFALLALTSVSAFAGVEGEHRCKNKDGIPDNVYRISNQSINAGGPTLPYVEIERHYRKDANSPVEQSQIRGWGTEIVHGTTTTIMIAALRLEFLNGQLFGCQKE